MKMMMQKQIAQELEITMLKNEVSALKNNQ